MSRDERPRPNTTHIAGLLSLGVGEKMSETKCEYCGDSIDSEPVTRGNRIYCTDACAFEATRSIDCGGRTDSVSAPPVVEFPVADHL